MEYFDECPECGGTNVVTRPINDYRFQYGETGSAVMLCSTTPFRVGTCLTCDYEWTAADAEDAIDGEVRNHLARKQRFLELADTLFKETGLYSDSRHFQEHAAYKELVDMGMPVVPILLDAMRSPDDPIGHWFLVVRDICPDHPEIPDDMRGKIREIEALYVKWGQEKGLLA